MIQIKCPHCSKEMRAADEQAGKKVRCPGCKEVLTLPAAATGVKAASPVKTSPKAAPPPLPKPPVDEDEDDAVPVARKRRPVDDDEDAPVARRRRRDEDDDEPEEDDEDERPRRKRSRRRSIERRGAYADCPNCDAPGHASRVPFTWWGGALGPWMFTHVRCHECGTCYNGRTGAYNTTAIIIYTVVGALVGVMLGSIAVCAGIMRNHL
jgi:phage FluMu protein Com